jgi:hypothetical protein
LNIETGTYSDATMRLMVRFARAGSVMESITIKLGIAMSVRKAVNNVWLMSNSKTLPARMSSMTPGLYRWK